MRQQTPALRAAREEIQKLESELWGYRHFANLLVNGAEPEAAEVVEDEDGNKAILEVYNTGSVYGGLLVKREGSWNSRVGVTGYKDSVTVFYWEKWQAEVVNYGTELGLLFKVAADGLRQQVDERNRARQTAADRDARRQPLKLEGLVDGSTGRA